MKIPEHLPPEIALAALCILRERRIIMKPTLAGADCAVQLNEQEYRELAQAGYLHIGRYFGQNPDKRLTPKEAQAAHAAGVKLWMVYEDGPTEPGYFSAARGAADGARIVRQARECGQPLGGEIFASVDYDAPPDDLAAIIAYQTALQAIVKGANYLASIYGSGLVCSALVHCGLAHSGWLSESSAWRGSASYAASGGWVVHQLRATYVCGIDVDTNVIDAAWGGCW